MFKKIGKLALLLMLTVTIVSGKSIIDRCTGCHGQNGEKKAMGRSKLLNKMSSNDIVKAMNGYKDGSYGGMMKNIMKAQIRGLKSDDITKLAKHFASSTAGDIADTTTKSKKQSALAKSQGYKTDGEYYRAIESFKSAYELIHSSVYDDKNFVEKTFKEVCSNGKHPEMCYSVGIAYEQAGYHEEESKFNLDLACNKGLGKACLHRGSGLAVRGKTNEAKKHFEKACKNKIQEGCFKVGKIIVDGVIYKEDKGYEILDKYCLDGNTKACFKLGMAHSKVDGQIKYLGLSCNRGHALACKKLGHVYGLRKNDRSTALEYFGKSCDLGLKIGCEQYNVLLRNF